MYPEPKMHILGFKICVDARSVMLKLNNSGYEAYVAGGAVRDLIRGCTPKDWDIATNATPDQVEELFGKKAIPTGKTFGTMTVILNVEPIEVTTYRLDGEYSDSRRPDNVEFAQHAYEDVVRRDFTMNGLFLTLEGNVLDWVGGVRDIHDKIVRCIGDGRERFLQDKARMLRAIRQATTMEFDLHEETEVQLCMLSDHVTACAGEFIQDEFNKILLSDHCGRGIRLLCKTGIAIHILPEVFAMWNFDQNNPWHHKTLLEHSISVMESVEPKVELRLAGLLHDTGKIPTHTIDDKGISHYYGHEVDSEVIARDICNRFRYSNEIKHTVCLLIGAHMMRNYNISDYKVRKFITEIGVENLPDLFQLKVADGTSAKPPFPNLRPLFRFQERCYDIIEAGDAFTRKDLAINGSHLKELGVKPGAEMGVILNSLLEHVLNAPDDNTEETLIKLTEEEYL